MNASNRDSGRTIGAVILIAVGVIFLLGQLFSVNVWNVVGGLFNFDWPFWIIVPGLILLAVGVLGGRSLVGFTVPGAVVTGTGLILLFQDRTGRFETWAYLWGLYPVFVGLGLMFIGERTNNPGQAQGGRRAVVIGLVLTVVFGIFMESIFSGAFDTIVKYLIPIVLIGGGALLLRRGAPAPVTDVPVPDVKRKNDADISPELRKRIDEAINE